MSTLKVGTIDELNDVQDRIEVLSLAVEGLGVRYFCRKEGSEIAELLRQESEKLNKLSKLIWPDKQAAKCD
jgi:hypothetical protein